MKIEKLTPEQEEQIPAVRDEFLRIGLSTDPADFDAAEVAIRDAYRIAGLEEPKLFIRLQSPLEGAIGAAILKNTRFDQAQIGAQVRDQVGAQVRDQVSDQVWDQVWAQVWAQVSDQVRDQVSDQVSDQVRDQVGAQVRDQVRAQVRDQVGAQVRDQVWAQVWAAFYSQHDAAYLGWLAYFRRVVGLPGTEKIDPLLRIAESCGWVWFFSGAVVMTDRPKSLRWDDEERMHCETGPSIEYRDGLKIYAWHGTRIPGEWIEQPEKLTPQIALTWNNVDQRAAACNIIGWHNIIKSLDAKVIDEDPDPQIGKLVQVDLPDHGPQKFIYAMCGTGREVAVMADMNAKTIIEAQAASYGLSAKDFAVPEVRT